MQKYINSSHLDKIKLHLNCKTDIVGVGNHVYLKALTSYYQAWTYWLLYIEVGWRWGFWFCKPLPYYWCCGTCGRENDQIQAWVKLLRYIVVKWRHTHYPPERNFFLVYSLLFNLVHTTDENFIELGNGVLYYVLVLLLWVYLLNYWEDNLTNIFTGNTKNVRIFCLWIWKNQVMSI